MSTKDKYLITVGLIVAVILALIFFFGIFRPANATRVVKVDLCHFDGESGNFQTLNVAEAAVPAHVPGHDKDYLGACKEPTPTPIEEEECISVGENSEFKIVDEQVEPCDEPEVTPRVTPTVIPTTPPSPHGDNRSDGKSDGRSDGRSSMPQEYSCDVPGNCINK